MVTIRRSDLERVVRELESSPLRYSKQSCLGYVIQGLDDAGLEEDGRQLILYVQRVFDSTTFEVAESIYRKTMI